MDVVEHPQRVQARDVRGAPLLPVQPPEVHPLLLQGVVDAGEVGVGEGPVPDIEGDARARVRVQAQPGGHGAVGGLVTADPVGRVEVEGDLQAAPVEGGQEAPGVREEPPVPGVARPAVADRRVHVHLVPVHVDHGHGQGDALGGEAVHEGQVLLLGVGVVAAPPVTQEGPVNERGGPGQAEEVVQGRAVVLPVAEEVEVRVRGGAVHGARTGAGTDPLVLGQEQGGRVVQDGPAGQGQQAGAQGDGAVGLVQGAGGTAEVRGVGLPGVPGVPEVPGAAVGVDDPGA